MYFHSPTKFYGFGVFKYFITHFDKKLKCRRRHTITNKFLSKIPKPFLRRFLTKINHQKQFCELVVKQHRKYPDEYNAITCIWKKETPICDTCTKNVRKNSERHILGRHTLGNKKYRAYFWIGRSFVLRKYI